MYAKIKRYNNINVNELTTDNINIKCPELIEYLDTYTRQEKIEYLKSKQVYISESNINLINLECIKIMID